MRWKKCVAMIFGLLSCSVVVAQTTDFTFSPAEHVKIGDDVKLYFSIKDFGKKNLPLHMPNGLSLTYGTILALADFYGLVHEPISEADGRDEMESRFLRAFHSFASEPKAAAEVTAITNIMNNEIKYIMDGLKNGDEEEGLYAHIGTEFSRQYNCATGGGCNIATWWATPGRFLELSKENFDHFGAAALRVYKIGHEAAIKLAIAAHYTQDLKQLELAYAMNAFASHFLSDRFSTGHMRVPRKELFDHVTPSVVGSLLAGYMHNEESAYGLHVHNGWGERWMAYGDKSWFSDKSAIHREKQHAALQRSANEILYAYVHGAAPMMDVIDKMIPVPDEKENAGNQDIAALFFWDASKNKIMRRADVKKLYDMHWTDSWWGWSTLTELGINGDVPVIGQAELAQSKWRNEALKAGLITDKNVIAWLQSQKL